MRALSLRLCSLVLAGMFCATSAQVFAPTEALARNDAPASRRSSVIVGVRTMAQMSAVKAALVAKGGFVKKRYKWNAYLVSSPAGMGSPEFARIVRGIPGVRYAEGNATLHAVGTANDPLFKQQWGTKAIGAPTAWDSSQGSGIAIAVLDTGIDWTHRDLAGTSIVRYKNFVTPTATPMDDEGHGTHVSGILAAVRNNRIDIAGTAPLATLYACKVLDSNGSGDIATISDAIRDVADNTPCRIFSMSFGAPASGLTNAESVALKDAIAHAQAKGVLLVAATGNDGISTEFYPASVEGVIGVGAVDNTMAWASFSDFGISLVDLVAPGVNIVSTIPGNQTAAWDGTSMATPYVSASAALVWSLRPSMNATELATLLEDTAGDLGAKGVDKYFGHGLVRPDRAIGLPPVTALHLSPASPDGASGWYRTVPNVTLDSDDALATFQYAWDGGAWSTYTAPIQPPQGTHTLSYYATGSNGKTAATKTHAFKVDSIAPVTSISGIPASGIGSAPVVFTLAASDAGSGVARRYYMLDHVVTEDYLAAVAEYSAGAHSARYWSVDKAGNVEQGKTATFTVTADATPIRTRLTISSSASKVRVKKAFTLSGTLKPGQLRDPVCVQIKAPGNAFWSCVSDRLTYKVARSAATWWYRYVPRRRGIYHFRAQFSADAVRSGCFSRTIAVTAR